MEFADHSEQLGRHYQCVLEDLRRREGELDGLVSAEYRTRMMTGLQHWVDGARAGNLAWGIFTARN